MLGNVGEYAAIAISYGHELGDVVDREAYLAREHQVVIEAQLLQLEGSDPRSVVAFTRQDMRPLYLTYIRKPNVATEATRKTMFEARMWA